MIWHFLKKKFGALAQLARAPALHAGGQRFDSVRLHQLSNAKKKIKKLIFFFYIFNF